MDYQNIMYQKQLERNNYLKYLKLQQQQQQMQQQQQFYDQVSNDNNNVQYRIVNLKFKVEPQYGSKN
jgi:hypothetical protein